MELIKPSPINLARQAELLQFHFAESQCLISSSTLVWKYDTIPTPLSNRYTIKVVYRWNTDPDVFVIGEKLKLANGKTKLPHVYSTPMQHLCLYYRNAREWNSHMLLAKTVIPWASEWLQFYEIWLVKGIWQGGGIEHENAMESKLAT
jgi:hypothetical protein